MGGFNIPLMTQAPQPVSGTDLLQQGMGMANLATATKMNQARLQEEQLRVKSAEEDREDANAIQQEFMNPAHLKPSKDDPQHREMDFDSLRGALQGKVRLRNLQKLDADHQQQVRSAMELATMDKVNQTSKLALQKTQNEVIGREIQGLEELDDKDKPAYYVGALDRLKKQGIPTEGMPETIPADGSFNQQLNAIAASHGYKAAITNDAYRKAMTEQRLATATKTANADKEAELGRKREAVARMYLAADPQTAEEHLAVVDEIDKKYPDIAAEYDAIKFDPTKTPQAIQNMALSAKDRTTTGMTQQRIDETASRNAALNALSEVRNQIQTQRLELLREKQEGGGNDKLIGTKLREMDNHERLQTQEQEAWQIHGALGDVLRVPNEGMFYDPTTKSGVPIKMDPEKRKQIKARMDLEETRAKGLAMRAETLRRTYHWGEFQDAQPAAPAAPKQAAAPAKPPDSVVNGLSPGIHTFQNGQTWMKNADGSIDFVPPGK